MDEEKVRYDFSNIEIELARLEFEHATFTYALGLKKRDLKDKVARIHDDIELLKRVKKYNLCHGEEATLAWIQGKPLTTRLKDRK